MSSTVRWLCTRVSGHRRGEFSPLGIASLFQLLFHRKAKFILSVYEPILEELRSLFEVRTPHVLEIDASYFVLGFKFVANEDCVQRYFDQVYSRNLR